MGCFFQQMKPVGVKRDLFYPQRRTAVSTATMPIVNMGLALIN